MSKSINLLELAPGMHVLLANGALVEIVDNPQDGMWLICRYLSAPNGATLLPEGEHTVFAQDVSEVR